MSQKKVYFSWKETTPKDYVLPTMEIKGLPALEPYQRELNCKAEWYFVSYPFGGHTFKKKNREAVGSHESMQEKRARVQDIKALAQHFKLHQDFRNEEKWAELSAALSEETQPTFNKIRRRWQTYALLSHYTQEALWELADQLDYLKNLLNAMQERIQGLKVAQAYRNYLIKYHHRVTQLQRHLALALLSRLPLALMMGDASQYDPLLGLLSLSKEDQEHLFPKGYQIPQALSPLDTPRILRYLNDHRNCETSRKFFKQLNTRNQEAPIVMDLLKPFLMPRLLRDYIPEWDTWFPWLFKGHHLRYTFFNQENRQALLLSVMALNHPNPSRPTWELSDSAWQKLKHTGDLLQQEQAHVVQARRGLGRFQGQTSAFLSAWEKQVKIANQQRLTQEIDYFEQLVKQGPPLDWLLNPNHNCLNGIMAAAQTLTQALYANHGNPELLTRWQELKTKLLLAATPKAYRKPLNAAFKRLIPSSAHLSA